MIDRHGTPQSFDPSSQNMFDPSIPLTSSHWICDPERMTYTDGYIEKSWMLREIRSIEEDIKGKTPLVGFENKLAEDYKRFTAIAKRKSEECLGTKLDKVRPFTNAAAASVRSEWEDAIRRVFSTHMEQPIARIVFPYSDFKHVKRSNREVLHDGSVRVNHEDYYVMDAYVYIENGEFVDGYVVSLYKDMIQNSEYAQFYGKDANGNLRPSQRVLKKNF